MKNIKPLMLALVCSSLISCSSGKEYSVSNQSKDYLSAKSIPTIKVPPGVSKPAFKSRYPVSDKHYSEKQTQINIVPPGLYSDYKT